jgi:hypothetical protein
MESGHAHLFDEQVISYTTQGREHSHVLIVEAIERAVQTASRLQQTTAAVEVPQSKSDGVHDLDDDSQTELTAALHLTFGTAETAFESFSNDEGTIGKKEFRRMIKKTLPTLSKEAAKALKKKLPKKVGLVEFCELMDQLKPKDEQSSASKSTTYPPSHLARLPSDVPVLPTSFKSRPHAQEQLVAALLDSSGSRSTAVIAPKSRVSSQGMGGVGKTMLTAAVVRDERIRGAFESIAWIGMSQQPELLQLQGRLYQQLHPQNEVMPSKATSLDARIRELGTVLNPNANVYCICVPIDKSKLKLIYCTPQNCCVPRRLFSCASMTYGIVPTRPASLALTQTRHPDSSLPPESEVCFKAQLKWNSGCLGCKSPWNC